MAAVVVAVNLKMILELFSMVASGPAAW